jgi:hypothetical protein
MRRATLFEIIVSAALLTGGLYMLHEGLLNNSNVSGPVVIFGAVCFTLSLLVLAGAVRSVLWHRRMLRHASPKRR